jgi:hypothetical protein
MAQDDTLAGAYIVAFRDAALPDKSFGQIH